MGKVVFWDVDTQYDFIMPDGKLCIPGAVDLLHNLGRLTQAARSHPERIQVVASMDDHQESDPEISGQPDFQQTFPPHCLHGSVGQMKVMSTEPQNPLHISSDRLEEAELSATLEGHRGEIVILKKRFDVFSNPNTEPIVRWLDPEEIYLYGVALDVCNAHAVEGLLRLQRPNLFLVRDATEAIDRQRGERLVERWGREGVRIIGTEAVCRRFAASTG
ncbi:MAG: cysteine hydrolase [Acidobacteria bacterium]|nr:cysteine hydrolase [Acidobacteriota bacterium]